MILITLFLTPPQAYYGHRDALCLLSETLVSLDVRDTEGRTALYLAAQRGFTPCVEVLLKHQASYTLKEHKRRWMALHTAGKCGGFLVRYALLVIILDFRIVDTNNKTSYKYWNHLLCKECMLNLCQQEVISFDIFVYLLAQFKQLCVDMDENFHVVKYTLNQPLHK